MPALASILALSLAFCAADEPAPPAARAPDRVLPGGIAVELLTAEEARAVLADADDPSVASMSRLEISLRLGEDLSALTDDEARAKYRSFLAEQATDWPEEERVYLLGAMAYVARACKDRYPAILPARWRFIRTTGKEIDETTYSRGDCIILPAQIVKRLVAKEVGLSIGIISVETFAVWWRTHPVERDALCGELGFRPISRISLPESLERVRLTTRFGRGGDYATTIRDPKSGEETSVVLLPTSRTPVFRKSRFGFFEHLLTHFYALEGEAGPSVRLDDKGAPIRWVPYSVPSFVESLGGLQLPPDHPGDMIAHCIATMMIPGADTSAPPSELLDRIAVRLGGNARIEPSSSKE